MRVLHLPSLVGGMAWGLAQGERVLGLDSRVLTTSGHWQNYPYDISLQWEQKNAVSVFTSSIKAFLKYRKKFDVFHFNFGSTLTDFRTYGMHLLDLPFYPRGKKIIFTYNGCDARQKYATMERVEFASCHQEDCYGGMCNSGARDNMRKQRIQKVSKYAHHIFAVNPDLLYFLPKDISSFLPYSIASWYEIQRLPYRIERKIRIVHSPTNRVAKGTPYILRALENLKKRYPIEIVLIENISHQEALEEYRRADLVIDQILIGWYGGFAVEGMKMGKPVCAFIREEDMRFVPEGMAQDVKQTIINMNPLNIEAVLETYLQNPHLLKEKGDAGVEYVHKWHDPFHVAEIAKAVYEE